MWMFFCPWVPGGKGPVESLTLWGKQERVFSSNSHVATEYSLKIDCMAWPQKEADPLPSLSSPSSSSALCLSLTKLLVPLFSFQSFFLIPISLFLLLIPLFLSPLLLFKSSSFSHSPSFFLSLSLSLSFHLPLAFSPPHPLSLPCHSCCSERTRNLENYNRPRYICLSVERSSKQKPRFREMSLKDITDCNCHG